MTAQLNFLAEFVDERRDHYDHLIEGSEHSGLSELLGDESYYNMSMFCDPETTDLGSHITDVSRDINVLIAELKEADENISSDEVIVEPCAVDLKKRILRELLRLFYMRYTLISEAITLKQMDTKPSTLLKETKTADAEKEELRRLDSLEQPEGPIGSLFTQQIQLWLDNGNRRLFLAQSEKEQLEIMASVKAAVRATCELM